MHAPDVREIVAQPASLLDQAEGRDVTVSLDNGTRVYDVDFCPLGVQNATGGYACLSGCRFAETRQLQPHKGPRCTKPVLERPSPPVFDLMFYGRSELHP